MPTPSLAFIFTLLVVPMPVPCPTKVKRVKVKFHRTTSHVTESCIELPNIHYFAEKPNNFSVYLCFSQFSVGKFSIRVTACATQLCKPGQKYCDCTYNISISFSFQETIKFFQAMFIVSTFFIKLFRVYRIFIIISELDFATSHRKPTIPKYQK